MVQKAGFLVVGLVVGLLIGRSYLSTRQPVVSGENVPIQGACTMEAKLCPDGSAVGRSGPNCEFAACPGAPVATSSTPGAAVTTTVDGLHSVSYRYGDVKATFVTAYVWPPMITFVPGAFSCDERSAPNAPRTVKRTIGNKQYCLTTQAEGAAGSTYTDYTYETAKDDKVVSVRFTLRTVQCDNYDDPQKTACKKEGASFNPDTLVQPVIESLQLK